MVPKSPEGKDPHEADIACCIRDAGAGARTECPGVRLELSVQLLGTCSVERCWCRGARAEIQLDIFQTAVEDNKTPGAVVSEFSRDHLGSAGNCLGD